MCLMHSVKKSFSNWPSQCSLRQPWNSKLTFRGAVGLLPVSNKCKNSERVGWVGGRMGGSEIIYFLSRCRNLGPERGETCPRSHSKTETCCFGKGSLTSGLSFFFCPQPWKTWEAGGIIWPGGQAAWGTWLWNVLGKQDAFSSRPNKPTGLCVARKGSGYLPPASVSFGLSTPAAKCPKRVRLDKSGKVRGWRWQNIRDQSLRDVPEPPLLHFLSKGWESQSDPPLSLHSLPSLWNCGLHPELLQGTGSSHPGWNRINSWNLDAGSGDLDF